MLVLDLPIELIYHILTFTEWQDVLSFVCTAKCITERVLSKSDLQRLRTNGRDLLLLWEATKGQRKDLWYRERKWNDYWGELNTWTYPCYTCLRRQPRRLTLNVGPMSSDSSKGLGRVDAHKRICVPCGARTGYYLPGSRAGYLSICEECICLLDPSTGWPLVGTTYEERQPVKKDRTQLGIYAYQELGHRWWSQTHVCYNCAAHKGWTVEDMKANPHQQKRERLHKERQRAGTLAVVARMRVRGRVIRAQLGVQEPEDLVNIIESLQVSEDGARL